MLGEQIKVYQIYMDFKQAYDSINHEKLYKIMYDVGIPSELIRLCRATTKDLEAQVKIQTQLTEPFTIRQVMQRNFMNFMVTFRTPVSVILAVYIHI
jgi:hypothetical protein